MPTSIFALCDCVRFRPLVDAALAWRQAASRSSPIRSPPARGPSGLAGRRQPAGMHAGCAPPRTLPSPPRVVFSERRQYTVARAILQPRQLLVLMDFTSTMTAVKPEAGVVVQDYIFRARVLPRGRSARPS